VNVSSVGTDYHWFASGGSSNPNSVCPNWQIYKTATSGPGGVGTVQMLPFNWESWCQADGNSWGPSIETAGMPGEAMTPYQLAQIAKIYKIGHDEWGWPYRITDSINKSGFGTHVMGGLAWGGHSCPGPGPRAGQRTAILTMAQQGVDDVGQVDSVSPAALEQIRAYLMNADKIATGETGPGANEFAAQQSYIKSTDKVAKAALAAASAAQTKVQAATDKADILAAIAAIPGGSAPAGDVPATVHFGG
jgi:hypothetical protein